MDPQALTTYVAQRLADRERDLRAACAAERAAGLAPTRRGALRRSVGAALIWSGRRLGGGGG